MDYKTPLTYGTLSKEELAAEIQSKRLNIWYLAFCSSGSYNGSR